VGSEWSNSGLDLQLDFAPAGGRRAGLERALRAAIRDGRLAPGTRLPATQVLADELGVARGTVTVTYDQLTVYPWS
jgi:GntR family transcriptional regulator/MocR family aminotransferase